MVAFGPPLRLLSALAYTLKACYSFSSIPLPLLHSSRTSISSNRFCSRLMSSTSPDGEATVRGEIYAVPGSGWASPDWNWGYASGTGHDCAMICRRRWSAADSRAALVEALLHPPPADGGLVDADAARDPPFEEVKLVLGLAWQCGRWDGSDGGRGGYGEVLAKMASKAYEPSDDPAKSRSFVEDMRRRYRLLGGGKEDAAEMDSLDVGDDGADLDEARRRCAGLVLRAMGFVQNGL
eukprot:CAMPEP_0113552588 /NCGR_PEP_ID=MMETSP0015_2-20120614/15150_1 /TAXON_ID=2838 /ORGANISM="Odontella" /LENGTH=236 /DNA_ID=CAMNT_0000453581 /DNA_START=10 /DNA_END=720 /DNA_ORIENTATION=- /assembly_acc=CAM_ASM_000160